MVERCTIFGCVQRKDRGTALNTGVQVNDANLLPKLEVYLESNAAGCSIKRCSPLFSMTLSHLPGKWWISSQQNAASLEDIFVSYWLIEIVYRIRRVASIGASGIRRSNVWWISWLLQHVTNVAISFAAKTACGLRCHEMISQKVLLSPRPDDSILSKDTTFSSDGIHYLPDRWLKVAESNYEYFDRTTRGIFLLNKLAVSSKHLVLK